MYIRNILSAWFECYKSYWVNLAMFIVCNMISTILLNNALSAYINEHYWITTLNIVGIGIMFILGLRQFKKYKDKERYRMFLYFKRLIDNEKTK